MDLPTLNRTTPLLPLLGRSLRKSGRYHVGACPFCGGRDRFTVKHTPQGDRWHCRKCGDGKYHTVIDFVMNRDGCDLQTATRRLGGLCRQTSGVSREARVSGRAFLKPPKPSPPESEIALPSAEWQARAWKAISAASNLLASEAGRAGRDYLARRGLGRAAWNAWLLGQATVFDPKARRKRPAIVIPWFDMDPGGETISAVKYRLMDDDPDSLAPAGAGLRYLWLPGSRPLLYGLAGACESDAALLLLEGELNALSAWQCLRSAPEAERRGWPRVSVLSFGSEGGGGVDVLRRIARKYAHVYVWADDLWDAARPQQARRARELRLLVCGRGQALRSALEGGEGGVKLDANELLQRGQLAALLSHVMGGNLRRPLLRDAICD